MPFFQMINSNLLTPILNLEMSHFYWKFIHLDLLTEILLGFSKVRPKIITYQKVNMS